MDQAVECITDGCIVIKDEQDRDGPAATRGNLDATDAADMANSKDAPQ
jgi:hypothetical protein